MKKRNWIGIILLSVMLILTACGGGNGTPTPAPPVQERIDLVGYLGETEDGIKKEFGEPKEYTPQDVPGKTDMVYDFGAFGLGEDGTVESIRLQMQQDGYSIFGVGGDMTKEEAKELLSENPVTYESEEDICYEVEKDFIYMKLFFEGETVTEALLFYPM